MVVTRRYARLPLMQLVMLSATRDLASSLALLLVLLLTIPAAGYCQGTAVSGIIDRIIAGEHRYVENLKKYSPRVETYLQYDDADAELGDKVRKDAYFLGRVNFTGKPQEISFTPVAVSDFHWLHSGLRRFKAPFVSRLMVDQFMTATLVDAQTFDTQHYSFEPVGWEYLGDVRCLALDVHPACESTPGVSSSIPTLIPGVRTFSRTNGCRCISTVRKAIPAARSVTKPPPGFGATILRHRVSRMRGRRFWWILRRRFATRAMRPRTCLPWKASVKWNWRRNKTCCGGSRRRD